MNGIPESQMSEFAPDAIALIGTGAVKVLQLTQGKVAIVDEEDYEWLSVYRWWAIKGAYTFYTERYNNGVRFKMHRDILGLPPRVTDGEFGDHINRYGLDNRRANLRIVNKSLNCYNTKMRKSNTSGYRGVSVHNKASKKKLAAKIGVMGKIIELGFFCDAIEAAKAYDKAAIKYYGENALLNFPDDIDAYAEKILEKME